MTFPLDLNRTSQEVAIGLINLVLHTNLSSSNIALSEGLPIDNAGNIRVTVYGKPNQPMVGRAIVEYKRLDLGVLFTHAQLSGYCDQSLPPEQAILKELQERFNILLDLNEIAVFVKPEGQVIHWSIKPKFTHLIYTGTISGSFILKQPLTELLFNPHLGDILDQGEFVVENRLTTITAFTDLGTLSL